MGIYLLAITMMLSILLLYCLVVSSLGQGGKDNQGGLSDKIERYIKLLEEKRDVIDKFLQENYSDFNHSDYTPEEYVSHPINAYLLMKRTSVLWQAAKPGILDATSEELWKEIQADMDSSI